MQGYFGDFEQKSQPLQKAVAPQIVSLRRLTNWLGGAMETHSPLTATARV